MRHLLPLLCLLLGACSRSPEGGSAPQPADPSAGPATGTPSATETVTDADVSERVHAATLPGSPSPDSPLMVHTDAGLLPAAQAARVLHVGDSMAPLVGNYLRPLYTRRGRNYWVATVVSSDTMDWSGERGQRLLQDAMYKYDPEVVLISLGSNELFYPKPESRAYAIRKIVEDTRGRPCLWIGPPVWKKDLGFIAVLKQNLGHCRYLDSEKLRLERMEDGRHPSWSGSYRWASAVWRALGGTEPVPTGTPKTD